jgi:hypothetical protein
MSIESRLSGHWTDEQIVDHIYGVGPADGHIDNCQECAGRFLAFQQRRLSLDSAAPSEEALSGDFIAAQRRAIYAKIGEPRRFWSLLPLRRVASAAATVVVLAGAFLFYQDRQARQVARAQVSDAQLAQEVSQMAFDTEPVSTAPLKALFVE